MKIYQKYPIFASLQRKGLLSAARQVNVKRSRGRVARQSSAKARTAVRIRSRPPDKKTVSRLGEAVFFIAWRPMLAGRGNCNVCKKGPGVLWAATAYQAY